MKIGIICAADTELEPFFKHMKNCTVTERAMLQIYECTINDICVTACFSGVCKVNAAIAAQILIDCFHVQCIINSGTCGGMTRDLEIFDTVISTEAAYHDVSKDILTEFHPWMSSVYFPADRKLLELCAKAVSDCKTKHRIVFGRMVTGEVFITDGMREGINQDFSPLSVDMETGSIAHVCYVNKIPFVSIRTITDTPDHGGSEQFELNCEKAAELAKDITLLLIDRIRQEGWA